MVNLFTKRKRPDSYQGFSKYTHEINNYNSQQQQHTHAGLPVNPSTTQNNITRSQSMTNAGQAAVAALRLHSSPVKQQPHQQYNQTLAQKQYGRSNSLSNNNRSNSLRSNSLRQYTYHPKPSYSTGPSSSNKQQGQQQIQQPRRYNSLGSNSYSPRQQNNINNSNHNFSNHNNDIQEENDLEDDVEEQEVTITTTETKVVDSFGRITSITTKTVKQLADGSEVTEIKTKNISRVNSRTNSLNSNSYQHQQPQYNRTNSISNSPVNLKKIDEHLHNFDYDYQVDQQPLTLNQDHNVANEKLGAPFDENENVNIPRTSSISSQQKPLRSILKSTPRPNFEEPQQNIESQPQAHPYKTLRDNKMDPLPKSPQQSNILSSPASSIKFNDNVKTIPIQIEKSIPSKPAVSKTTKPKASNQQVDADFYAAAMQAAYKKVYGETQQPQQPVPLQSPQNPQHDAMMDKHKKFGFIPLSPRSNERTSSIDSLVENKVKRDQDAFERKNQVEQQQVVPPDYQYKNHHKEFAVHSMREDPKINKEKAKEEKRLEKVRQEEEKKRVKEQQETEKQQAKEQQELEKRQAKEQQELEKRRKKEERKSKFSGLFGKKDKRRNSYTSTSSFESNQQPKLNQTTPISPPIQEEKSRLNTSSIINQPQQNTYKPTTIDEGEGVRNHPVINAKNETSRESEFIALPPTKHTERKPVSESPLIERQDPISENQEPTSASIKDQSEPEKSIPIDSSAQIDSTPIESTSVVPIEPAAVTPIETTKLDSEKGVPSNTKSDTQLSPASISQPIDAKPIESNPIETMTKDGNVLNPVETRPTIEDHTSIPISSPINPHPISPNSVNQLNDVTNVDDQIYRISVPRGSSYDEHTPVGQNKIYSSTNQEPLKSTNSINANSNIPKPQLGEIDDEEFENLDYVNTRNEIEPVGEIPILNDFRSNEIRNAKNDQDLADFATEDNTGIYNEDRQVDTSNNYMGNEFVSQKTNDQDAVDFKEDDNTGVYREERHINQDADSKIKPTAVEEFVQPNTEINSNSIHPYSSFEKINANDITSKTSSSYEQVEQPAHEEPTHILTEEKIPTQQPINENSTIATPQVNATPNFHDEVKASAFVKQDSIKQPNDPELYANTNFAPANPTVEDVDEKTTITKENASKKSKSNKKPSKFKERFFKYFINTYDN